MIIKPSACIRQNYNDIANQCRDSAQPIYLTKNGEGDMVIMSIEAFERREKMLALKEEILQIELNRLNGAPTHSVDELSKALDRAISLSKAVGK